MVRKILLIIVLFLLHVHICFAGQIDTGWIIEDCTMGSTPPTCFQEQIKNGTQPYQSGEEITFTIHIKNTGEAVAQDMNLDAVLVKDLDTYRLITQRGATIEYQKGTDAFTPEPLTLSSEETGSIKVTFDVNNVYLTGDIRLHWKLYHSGTTAVLQHEKEINLNLNTLIDLEITEPKVNELDYPSSQLISGDVPTKISIKIKNKGENEIDFSALSSNSYGRRPGASCNSNYYPGEQTTDCSWSNDKSTLSKGEEGTYSCNIPRIKISDYASYDFAGKGFEEYLWPGFTTIDLGMGTTINSQYIQIENHFSYYRESPASYCVDYAAPKSMQVGQDLEIEYYVRKDKLFDYCSPTSTSCNFNTNLPLKYSLWITSLDAAGTGYNPPVNVIDWEEDDENGLAVADSDSTNLKSKSIPFTDIEAALGGAGTVTPGTYYLLLGLWTEDISGKHLFDFALTQFEVHSNIFICKQNGMDTSSQQYTCNGGSWCDTAIQNTGTANFVKCTHTITDCVEVTTTNPQNYYVFKCNPSATTVNKCTSYDSGTFQINSKGEETCGDNIDNDCDTQTDEGCLTTLTAATTATPASGPAPLIVALTCSASGGSGTYTYSWNFGDGSSASATPNPSHTYSTAGAYSATCTATDSSATPASDPDSTTITVSAAGSTTTTTLTAATTATPASGTAPLTVNFACTAAGGDGTYTYSWNFGDSSSASATPNPSHTYSTAGAYSATCTVTSAGTTASSPQSITVLAPTTQTCSAQSGAICADGKYCDGTQLTASDSTKCCSVTCKDVTCSACNGCGTGLFNICDRTECHSNCGSVNSCYFTAGTIGGTCSACSGVTLCNTFNGDETTCGNDPCSLDCIWFNGNCITNRKPTANAGNDRTVKTGEITMLLGSGTDPDNDPITYQWQLITKPGGSVALLSSANIANPTFTQDITGDYVFKLVVNDGKLLSDYDEVKISSAIPPSGNNKPLAYAGADRKVKTGNEVQLNGIGSDINGDTYTFHWALGSIPTDSNTKLSNNLVSNPKFTPDKNGDYTLTLIVNDGKEDSIPDDIKITASSSSLNIVPSADAGPDMAVQTLNLVTLDGQAYDPDTGDTLTYQWADDTKPTGSASSLFQYTSLKPTFTPDVDGVYKFSLTINDGTVAGFPDMVVITSTSPDTANPTLSIIAPSGTILTSTVEVRAAFTDQSIVYCNASLDDIKFYEMTDDDSISGTAKYTFTNVADGFHKITVNCTDENSYYNNKSVAFIIDTTTPDTKPPNVTIIFPQENDQVNSSNVQVEVNYSDETNTECLIILDSGETKEMSGDGSTRGEISYSFKNVSNGTHMVSVNCTDENKNNNSELVEFSVKDISDHTPPKITKHSPTGTINVKSITLIVYTDEKANCRHSSSKNIPYDSMSHIFSSTGSKNHTLHLSRLTNGIKQYYIKCEDYSEHYNQNQEDYGISLTVNLDSTKQPEVTRCTNGHWDRDYESDTDCGDTCSVKCSISKKCRISSDCVSNLCEKGICKYSPSDTDGDKLSDKDDNCPSAINPAQKDFDSDGLGDACDTDDDNDSMPDEWEIQYGLNPLDSNDAGLDKDGDGLTNLEEYQYSTNPNEEDSDGDGISDKKEIDAETDPNDETSKPKNTFLHILLIILLVSVILASSGWAVYRYYPDILNKLQKNKQKQQNKLSERNPGYPRVRPSPTAKLTSSGEKYRSGREKTRKERESMFESFGKIKQEPKNNQVVLNEDTPKKLKPRQAPLQKKEEDVFKRLKQATKAKK